MTQSHTLALILVAGGSSTRMGGPLPKPFMRLHGKRVIDYSIDIFAQLPMTVEICVVCAPEYHSTFDPSVTLALPGRRRQDSVFNGLSALKSNADFIAVHDAARPLITADLIHKVVEAAVECGGALAAVPVKSTIKIADIDCFVADTPNRSLLWEAQTPQIFEREILNEAFRDPINNEYDAVDDASMVERIGHAPKLVMGSYSNIKLTTVEDLHIAQSFIVAEDIHKIAVN